MAVSFIGESAFSPTTATIPAHQVGDLILAFAVRVSDATVPEIPAGWTTVRVNGANTLGAVVAYKFATTTSETSGTWTSEYLMVQVYRGVGSVGASSTGSGTTSSTISYPALTLQIADGTSWAVRFAAHRSATNLNSGTPGGYTPRSSTSRSRGLDSNGGLSTNPTVATQTVNTTNTWRAYTVELRTGTVPTTNTTRFFQFF